MRSGYKSLLEKINESEKKLSPKRTYNFVQENKESQKSYLMKQDCEAVEEFKNLKENITAGSFKSYTPAYQPVAVRNNQWNQ